MRKREILDRNEKWKNNKNSHARDWGSHVLQEAFRRFYLPWTTTIIVPCSLLYVMFLFAPVQVRKPKTLGRTARCSTMRVCALRPAGRQWHSHCWQDKDWETFGMRTLCMRDECRDQTDNGKSSDPTCASQAFKKLIGEGELTLSSRHEAHALYDQG